MTVTSLYIVGNDVDFLLSLYNFEYD